MNEHFMRWAAPAPRRARTASPSFDAEAAWLAGAITSPELMDLACLPDEPTVTGTGRAGPALGAVRSACQMLADNRVPVATRVASAGQLAREIAGIVPPHAEEVAEFAHRLTAAYALNGEPGQAVPIVESLATAFRRYAGMTTPCYARILDTWGCALAWSGKLANGLDRMSEAADLYLLLETEASPRTIECWRRVAALYRAQGQPLRAAAVISELLSLLDRSTPGNVSPLTLAELCLDAGDARADVAAFQEAAQLQARAAAIVEAWPEAHPAIRARASALAGRTAPVSHDKNAAPRDFTSALAIGRSLGPLGRDVSLRCLFGMAALHRAAGRLDDATEAFRQCAAIVESLVIDRSALIAARLGMAVCQADAADWSAARKAVGSALRGLRGEARRSVPALYGMCALGACLHRLGRPVLSARVTRQALGTIRTTRLAEPALSASLLNNLALAQETQGNLEEAVRLLQRAVRLWPSRGVSTAWANNLARFRGSRVGKAGRPSPEVAFSELPERHLSACLETLRIVAPTGDGAFAQLIAPASQVAAWEAEQALRAAAAFARLRGPSGNERVLRAECRLAEWLSGQGRHKEAESMLDRSLAEHLATDPAPLPIAGLALTMLATACEHLESSDRGLSMREAAVQVAQAVFAPADLRIVITQRNLALALRKRGHMRKAEELLARCARQSERYGHPPAQLALTLAWYLPVLARRGLSQDAVTKAESFQVRSGWPGDADQAVRDTFEEGLAQACYFGGALARAEALWRGVLNRRAPLDPPSNEWATAANNFAVVLAHTRREKEAESLLGHAITARRRLGSPPYDVEMCINNLSVVRMMLDRLSPGAAEAVAQIANRYCGGESVTHPLAPIFLNNAACARMIGGLIKEAEQDLRRAQSALRRSEASPEAVTHAGVALNRAICLAALGDHAAAERQLIAAERIASGDELTKRLIGPLIERVRTAGSTRDRAVVGRIDPSSVALLLAA